MIYTIILYTVITWTKNVYVLSKITLNATLSHHIHLKPENNLRNGFPILANPPNLVSFMILLLLVLKLLQCFTPDGGHLEFVQYGRHRGSPSWLPREIGTLWSYLGLVQKWCLWNDMNNDMAKSPDYVRYCQQATQTKLHSLYSIL